MARAKRKIIKEDKFSTEIEKKLDEDDEIDSILSEIDEIENLDDLLLSEKELKNLLVVEVVPYFVDRLEPIVESERVRKIRESLEDKNV